MIRIRFHGRGGHGVKTASRICGTAACSAGLHVQDSPVYGAERRGAAIAAYTRIDDGPILERGVIDLPHLIILADETLLDDPAAGVLKGQEQASAVFVNVASASCRAANRLSSIQPRVITYDVTSCTLELLGRAAALSAGLAAAAARLAGLSEEPLLAAVGEELKCLGIPETAMATNIEIAKRVFQAVPSVEFAPLASAVEGTVHQLEFQGPFRGAPSIVAAGNAQLRQTGSWRVERPEIDYQRCTRCGICFVRCPDGAIALSEEGYPVIDYDHCKGCMICWDQCPVEGAIRKEKEVKAW
jgi:pyruvate ferredoxin oxidoreductase gamma subunit